MNKRQRKKYHHTCCSHIRVPQGGMPGFYEFYCKANGEPCLYDECGDCKRMKVIHGIRRYKE